MGAAALLLPPWMLGISFHRAALSPDTCWGDIFSVLVTEVHTRRELVDFFLPSSLWIKQNSESFEWDLKKKKTLALFVICLNFLKKKQRLILTKRDRGRGLWDWCHCDLRRGSENSCRSLDGKNTERWESLEVENFFSCSSLWWTRF